MFVSTSIRRHLPPRWLSVLSALVLASFLVVPVAWGATMTVFNNTDAQNGDTSSPSALINDPGPDGISLRDEYTFEGGEPEGDYTWYMGLTDPGTTDLIGGVASAGFGFAP